MAAFEEAGALLHGHFQLASGRHSDAYIEKFNLLQWPRHTEVVCRSLASGGREFAPQLIVGPTTGGVIIAYEVARQLGLRGVIAERTDGGGRAIGRHFRIESGERALVVDDILTTGGSIRETLAAVVQAGGVPVGVAVMVDRSGGRVDFGVPLYAATDVEMQTWEPAACPLCPAGIPLEVT